jgi:hypothetical protein
MRGSSEEGKSSYFSYSIFRFPPVYGLGGGGSGDGDLGGGVGEFAGDSNDRISTFGPGGRGTGWSGLETGAEAGPSRKANGVGLSIPDVESSS